MAESKKKDTTPQRVLPSDVTALAQQHNLTQAEAERVAHGESVDTVKGERTVYRARYEALEANPAFHPLAAADAAAERRDAEQASEPVGPDPALPQSGPYGPNAQYAKVATPEDKDHLTGAEAAQAAAKQAH